MSVGLSLSKLVTSGREKKNVAQTGHYVRRHFFTCFLLLNSHPFPLVFLHVFLTFLLCGCE